MNIKQIDNPILKPFLESEINETNYLVDLILFDGISDEFNNYFNLSLISNLKNKTTKEELVYLETVLNNMDFILFKASTIIDDTLIMNSWYKTIYSITNLIKNLTRVDTIKEILKNFNFVKLMELFLAFDAFIKENNVVFSTSLLLIWIKVINESLIKFIHHNDMILRKFNKDKTIIEYWGFENKSSLLKSIKNK